MSRFFISLVVSGIVLVIVSLIWPRLTHESRPAVLQTVHDYALKTPVGIQTATVLGVSDESLVDPINPERIIEDVISETGTAVSERIDYIIMSQVGKLLQNRINQLDPRDKEILYQTICSSESASGSADVFTTPETTQ